MTLDKSALLRPATPILDLDIESCLSTQSWFSRPWLDDEKSTALFFVQALKWLKPFLGDNDLSAFQTRALTAGTTGSFQDFYQLNCNRKLKVLRGEYPFHRDVFESLNQAWSWLEIENLDANDFVILSVPFSADGEIHPQLFAILDRCEALQIPVLIDCAFAGLSNLVLPKLTQYQCVQKVCFSLSKIFNLGSLRCGFEFSRYQKGANFTLTEWDYGQKVAGFIGLHLMQQFPLHYIYNKYRAAQLSICQQLQIQASSTVIFGLGDNTWKEFSRDGYANRICLSDVLKL
jgi:hypothetical protein